MSSTSAAAAALLTFFRMPALFDVSSSAPFWRYATTDMQKRGVGAAALVLPSGTTSACPEPKNPKSAKTHQKGTSSAAGAKKLKLLAAALLVRL